MKRPLLMLLSLLAMLLCLGIARFWVRSYRHEDVLRLRTTDTSTWFLVSTAGRVRLVEQGITPINRSLYGSADFSTYKTLAVHSLQMAPINGMVVSGAEMRMSFATLTPHHLAGFEYLSWDSTRSPGTGMPPGVTAAFGIRHCIIGVPPWFLMAITGIPPILWLRRYLRQRHRERRRAKGLCPACGYDLRATKDRCPECGTPIPAATTIATAPRQSPP